MNVLILLNKPPYPPKDGSSLATLNMVKGLASAGHAVTVLAMSTQKHQYSKEDKPEDINDSINFQFVSIDTRIKPFKAFANLIFTKRPYNIERFIDNKFKGKLEQIISENHFDIIQLEGICLIPYCETIRSKVSTPIVYRSHNIEHEIWERVSINEPNRIKRWYFSLLANRIKGMEVEIGSKVDALVAISKRDESWFFKNCFSKPSTTIQSGYNISTRNEATGVECNDICFLGSLDWIPNQEGIFWFTSQVWPLVLEAMPSISFHVAGRNAPQMLIDKLSHIRNVVFHGEVDNAQNYLSNFSIIIVPLLSGSGMRVKIVEGMMLGKAIVTTEVGVEGIDATNNSELVIANSPEEFAKAIIKIAQNPEFKQSLIGKALTFANNHFDNKVLTKDLVDFYKKIV